MKYAVLLIALTLVPACAVEVTTEDGNEIDVEEACEQSSDCTATSACIGARCDLRSNACVYFDKLPCNVAGN